MRCAREFMAFQGRLFCCWIPLSQSLTIRNSGGVWIFDPIDEFGACPIVELALIQKTEGLSIKAGQPLRI